MDGSLLPGFRRYPLPLALAILLETPTGALADRVERRAGLLLGFLLVLPAIALMAAVRDARAYLAFPAVLLGIPNYRGGSLFRRVDGPAHPQFRPVLTCRAAALAGLILLASIALAMLVPAIRPCGER